MARQTHHKHSSSKGYRKLLDNLAALEDVHSVATGRVKPRMGSGRPVAQISKVRRIDSGLSITINTEGAIVDAYVVTDQPEAVAAAMAARIQGGDAPDVILFGTTYDGRDVMARLSVALDKPVLTNNTEIEADGDALVVTTQIFGGSLLARTTFTGAGPFLVSVRPKSFPAEAVGGGAPTVEALEIPELGPAGGARVTAVHVEESSGPKLDEAAVVVSGGRGLGEATKFEMVETLAKLLKGAPGASRAIVDAGWVPYSYQVGQTGKVVKPDVYLAAGISGATQHMVGMKGAKHIIAVNKDREAPIFAIADLGIVGDVHKVLPQLIEALQAR